MHAQSKVAGCATLTSSLEQLQALYHIDRLQRAAMERKMAKACKRLEQAGSPGSTTADHMRRRKRKAAKQISLGCKREMGHISAVYALGVDVAPTRQARAWLVERTISAMDFTCSAVQSDKASRPCLLLDARSSSSDNDMVHRSVSSGTSLPLDWEGIPQRPTEEVQTVFIMDSALCCSPAIFDRLSDLGQTITSSLLSQLQTDPHLAHHGQKAVQDDVSGKQHICSRAAGAMVSHVQAVQLMAVHQRYLQCTSELSQEHQELMSLLSINLHVASLGMHRDPEKGQSAAVQVVERLQSNVQRSSHAFASSVRECLVDVLKPDQVAIIASKTHHSSPHPLEECPLYHLQEGLDAMTNYDIA
ncbi:hypothetical protein WJX74_008405 [Apatococcus lobatus]|uniref:Uncharacterized protein n=1 Tax=Apatococcus lobatus TaxID=904363 RepID=A0AAW1RM10_9CHLO